MAKPPTKMTSPGGPQLGSFPLDHLHECKEEIRGYYHCLESNNYVSPMCREETKKYLQCRMDRGLMNKMDMTTLNIPETKFVPATHDNEKVVRDLMRRGVKTVNVAKYTQQQGAERMSRDDGFELDPRTGQRVDVDGSV